MLVLTEVETRVNIYLFSDHMLTGCRSSNFYLHTPLGQRDGLPRQTLTLGSIPQMHHISSWAHERKQVKRCAAVSGSQSPWLAGIHYQEPAGATRWSQNVRSLLNPLPSVTSPRRRYKQRKREAWKAGSTQGESSQHNYIGPVSTLS